ncbi:Zinc transporter 2, partial [Fragariocoptes setiger]
MYGTLVDTDIDKNAPITTSATEQTANVNEGSIVNATGSTEHTSAFDNLLTNKSTTSKDKQDNNIQDKNREAADDTRIVFSHCHVQDDASSLSSGNGNGNNGHNRSAHNGTGGYHHHHHGHGNGVDKSARRRLVTASIICLVFMIGELVGGILSNSLAIATDAAHLLTDFASFMISLLAIWLSSRPATRKMSFGWYRAEVIGALLSVLMIWLVTGLLVYMAIERLRSQQFEIDSTVMVITATAGLLVNIIMAIALHADGHGHIHKQHNHNRGKGNINVRAAFVHVIGDFLQSLGVLIAALVIHFRPDYQIVDPICTFLFSIIVLVTTINIIRDAINVLMEGMPDGINLIEVRESLSQLSGIVRVHNLRIWSLSLDKIAISAHLVIDDTVTASQALQSAVDMLKSDYDFFECTIQVEELKEDMKDCQQCQGTAPEMTAHQT